MTGYVWDDAPDGECVSETPDGVQHSTGADGGWNSLTSTGERKPPIQSGDWQNRSVPVRPRDRMRGITE